MRLKVDLIADMQYGSTGKGLLAGYLACHNNYDVVVNANMPNAGHTYIDGMGNKMVHKVLPNGIVGNPEFVLLGPGSVFNSNVLAMELDKAAEMGYGGFQVLIHPNAMELREEHIHLEKGLMDRIGSTESGAMAAQLDKMSRDPFYKTTVGHKGIKDLHRSCHIVGVRDYLGAIHSANNILAEGAQGFSLGINERFYPYCTSRDCNPSRLMSEMGIPWNMLRDVIGTYRTYPIRVGGNSGGHYDDQEEITWTSINQKPELTTVTNRERRLFTFSPTQTRDAERACAPTKAFLNFCNYVKKPEELMAIVECIEFNDPGKVRWLGWGPNHQDVKGVKIK